MPFSCGASEVAPDEMVGLCWVGVPSEPKEFVPRAIKAGHPRGFDIHVDENMQEVINLIAPTFELAKKRVSISESGRLEPRRSHLKRKS